MVKITREEVIKLAHISHISVHEDEIPGIITQLEAVLSYASGLKEIASTQNVLELSKNSNVMRNDDPVKFDSEAILALAPARESHYFIVPAVIK